MGDFAVATGLTGTARPERYLWTDAFAVCNFLGLHRTSGKAEYLELALRLVDQVHRVLGRHRGDDARRGWISGLDEGEGERHPTLGGLRIGKKQPERAAHEPFDPDAEWDRDGQYLHYLTQWMHALHRVAQETGKGAFDVWAAELARAAHAAFGRPRSSAGIERLVWKMSIDLKRVLVPSMGQHDALDCLVSYLEVQQAGADLGREISEMQRLAGSGNFGTGDALGIGGLLVDTYRLSALVRRGSSPARQLLQRLLIAARASLEALAEGGSLAAPAKYRLAFRELGLAIGLHAMQKQNEAGSDDTQLWPLVEAIVAFAPLATRIDAFWSEPANREAVTWVQHGQINAVMLATSLQPDGYLGASRPAS